ncbi:MAG: signal transduction protein [Gemmatimonadetes bacterium]|nr:signal transduction protein [Gemmatimonadota bacterium]
MSEVFVGRQPIFDRSQTVRAYELLFRSGERNSAGAVDGNRATADVLANTFTTIGLDQMAGHHPAFVNCTRELILGGTLMALPKQRIVLEILEDVHPDDELVAEVARLAEAGFMVALDDFVFSPAWTPLLRIAKIVKIDVLALSRAEINRQRRLLRTFGVRLLAEKVETQEDFRHFHDMGFDYFQGYFLSKPTVVRGRRMPSNRLMILELIARLADPDVDVEELESLIEADVGLSFKLLKYINSALFGLSKRVDSMRHAVVLLGLREIKRFATLGLIAGIEDKPAELLKVSLIRARMCEQIADALGRGGGETHFTVGLFSTADALMDAPMADVIASLPLSDDVKMALSDLSGPLSDVLRIAIACERCRWDAGSEFGVSSQALQEIYWDGLTWAELSGRGSAPSHGG